MPRIEGKTINELLRVEDITGSEIIPMAVYDEELSAYVTRGITLDNFFKTIYGMIQEADANISYIKEDMTSYVSELRGEDARLDEELGKTNTKLSYASEDLSLLHVHYHQIASYSYENVGELWDNIGYGTAYAYEEVAKLHQEDEILHAYAYEGIGHNEDMIVTSYETLSEKIDASYESALQFTATAYAQLDESMQAAYAGLAYAISYAGTASHEELDILHAYAYENVARLDSDIDEVSSYSHEGVGTTSYVNMLQDITLMNHANAISQTARALAYESYVNTIQSGHINTIYYENSTDAFNDWSNPDDDNVKPQR